MKAMRSARRIVLSRWAITIVVRSWLSIRTSSACCTTFSESLSSAEVASSRSRTFGLLTIARAMAILCFCPPLNPPPPSPTSVSYPLAIPMIKSWALALLAAASICSRVAPWNPYAIFLAIDPLNNVGSCDTIPIWSLYHPMLRSLKSTPSNSTAPPSGS
mmetsp:Transcript_14830/g.32579  ORF Transcript_14830/g.32579 Transcript_14830/m.32579 type:complete len:160 (-) Transcript_14830:2744-3223(-)